MADAGTFYSELLHVCVSLGTTTSAAPVWYAPLEFETFIFSLTAYRAWRDAKMISRPSRAPLLVLFYRGTSVFGCIINITTEFYRWNDSLYRDDWDASLEHLDSEPFRLPLSLNAKSRLYSTSLSLEVVFTWETCKPRFSSALCTNSV